MIQILNLGAGVQSSTVMLMSVDGILPPLDHAIFADTGWEPAAVYRQMDWLEKRAVDAGIRMWRVSSGNIKSDALRSQVRGKVEDGNRWAAMPYFVSGPGGRCGQIRRQCTSEYKIAPIERCIRRDILGLKPRQRAPKEIIVRQWYGISHDERQRMRISTNTFAVNYYPLVEMRYSRSRCLQWLYDRGYPEPPRSACIGCPYHHDREWFDMRTNYPEEWEDACSFDESIRRCGGMRGEIFLHSHRIPLRTVSLSGYYDPRQQVLPGLTDECSGMCGV